MITMRKETEHSIITKEIHSDTIYTTRVNKHTNDKYSNMESLFNYCNAPRGYARLLELRDYEYVRTT